MSLLPFNSKKFVCIEYPAIVKNPDKMLDSLGGEKTISQTYSDPTHRLEMRFRTSDAFSKPALGDRINTTNLLMKIRRTKKEPKDLVDGEDEYTYEAEILGIVDTTYKFQSMIDFQYLPMEKMESGGYRSLLEEVFPRKLEPMSWFMEPAPLFPLPPLFSRMDTPTDYHFRKDPVHKFTETQTKHSHVINQNRLRRLAHAQLVTIKDTEAPEIPLAPIPCALKSFSTKFCSEETVGKIRKLFEERPIWSKNALLARSGIRQNKLKNILPIIAYYFINGPWRGLWCRFAYDPFKNPESKNYQVLDYRFRQSNFSKKSWIKPKRSALNYNLPNKINQCGGRVATIQREMLNMDENKGDNKETNQASEALYRFRKEVLPPYRQLFYQMCDIEMDDIQKIINDPKMQNETCDIQHGWLVSSVQDKCRSILTTSVLHLMQQFEGEKQNQEEDIAASDDSDGEEAPDETLDNDSDSSESLDSN